MVDRRTSSRTARTLVIAASGLALGVLIGLVLGWYAFPVRWYDTDPSDLRLRHQMDYAIMVADSFALNGDVDLARQRLAELMDDDTSWEQVANFVARVAVAERAEGHNLAAARLDALASGASLPDPTLSDYRAPAERGTGPRVGLIAFGAVAFVFAAGALVWSIARMGGAAPQALADSTGAESWEEEPVQDGDIADTAVAKRPEAADVEPEPVRASGAVEASWETVPQVSVPEDAAGDEDLDVTELTADALVHVPALEDEGDEDDEFAAGPTPAEPPPEEPAGEEEPPLVAELDEAPAEVAEEPETELVPEVPPDALGVFQAVYEQDLDEFDCSFTIEDADGTFLGECGVGVRDLLDVEGEQLVDAFEIWLFDKADIRTVSAVVASEYAYEDEVLYNRLSSKGELVVAEDDLMLTLETQSLALTATITGYAYGDGGPTVTSHFVRFEVELVAERNPLA
ncbi:MAG: hypothetical protein ACP5G7_03550 [Anaerolineae bacterium]